MKKKNNEHVPRKIDEYNEIQMTEMVGKKRCMLASKFHSDDITIKIYTLGFEPQNF